MAKKQRTTRKKGTRKRVLTTGNKTLAREVRGVYAEFMAVTDKYIMRRDKERAEIDEATIAQDRAVLERLIADDYQFVDPFGKVYDKKAEIDKILSRRITFDQFEITEDNLRIKDSTAVTTGIFTIKGGMPVRFKESGVVRQMDMSGSYRSTHTFMKRGRVWQVVTSHISKVPEDLKFFH